MSTVNISPAVLDMKFMSRTKKKIEAQAAKKKEIEEKRRLLGSDVVEPETSSVQVKPDPDAPIRLEFERCYEKLDDLTFGRMSFKGFNPEVEKLMVYYERLKKGLQEEDSEEEEVADVNTVEMADALGGSLRKKFTNKRDRQDQSKPLRDESIGDKTAPKRKFDDRRQNNAHARGGWKRSRK